MSATDYTQAERDISADVDKLHRARTFKTWREPTWNARHERVRALSEAYGAAGYRAKLAEYDLAGNCTACGESGRCPGVHIVASQRPTKRDQVQQSLAFDLPLFARAS